MATITINGTEYNSDELTEKAKEQVSSLQFAQQEIKRIEAQLAIYKTAVSAYSYTLRNELENNNNQE